MIRRSHVQVAALGLAGALYAGCSRELTITQGPYINTAGDILRGRSPEDQTGKPLEINIVCVYESDLKKPANDRLKPGSGITSREWYEARPQPGDNVDTEEAHPRFRLPDDQVYLLTNDRTYYGKRIGAAMRGSKIDGFEKLVKEFDYSTWSVHDDNAVIYLFARFSDDKDLVLPVPPATFNPPGAYKEDLFVHIGVDPARNNHGQYIENKTDRKMHGK
jgi:hypothetical protein